MTTDYRASESPLTGFRAGFSEPLGLERRDRASTDGAPSPYSRGEPYSELQPSCAASDATLKG